MILTAPQRALLASVYMRHGRQQKLDMKCACSCQPESVLFTSFLRAMDVGFIGGSSERYRLSEMGLIALELTRPPDPDDLGPGSYPAELKQDQIDWLQERAAERRRQWAEHKPTDPPPDRT